MSECLVQRLGVEYAAPYRELMLEAYEHHPDAFMSSTAERAALPLSWWQKRLDDNPDAKERVFGAVSNENGQLLGVAGLSLDTRDKAAHKATLFGMYVRRNARGHGLGAQLVQAVLAEARRHSQLRVVQLTVTQGNAAAQHLYTAQGFQVFGIEPMAMRLGTEFLAKVHMWHRLK